jgi:DNA invertase Pin-like site-specific DNA recombinase
MRAIGYVRVSTAEQAAEGVSLDAQRARIAAWARVSLAKTPSVSFGRISPLEAARR